MASTKTQPNKKRRHTRHRYNPVKLDSGRKPLPGKVVTKKIEPYASTEGLPFTARKADPRPAPRKQPKPPAEEHTPAERAARLEALSQATQRGLEVARMHRAEQPRPHALSNLQRDLETTEATYRKTLEFLDWCALTPAREVALIRSYRVQGPHVRKIILEAMRSAEAMRPAHSTTIRRVLSQMESQN